MNVIYSKHYNINLGLLNYLHPFDGNKFQKIHQQLKGNKEIDFLEPESPVSMEVIDNFLSSIMRHRVRNKNGIFQALEIPRIPLVSFSLLDKKILSPMRWGVAGTILGAKSALENGGIYWNLSGGYHHAMQQNMEGFCIYNDIGICHQQLINSGLLKPEEKILIIDTDAHHGNGNAYTFMDNESVTLLDVYNTGIYPTSSYTRDRVDISVPLMPGTEGQEYLKRYREAIKNLDDDYKIAFVVAGTDPLINDKLGGLCLTIEDIAERERSTVNALSERAIPTVILGGGGYSKASSKAVVAAIQSCTDLDREVSARKSERKQHYEQRNLQF
ncbi:histone deacetylase family protein [Microbulbifer sp. TRSA005]|uniref:histone deacetylase family protein n=1 Tax=unclassified Microbulbifer TaxID=2619833 RepID=UPI00403A0797